MTQSSFNQETQDKLEKLIEDIVAHRNDKLVKAANDMMNWVPCCSSLPKGMIKDSGLTRREAEQVPFITEAYLYSLIGKEDARTLLALLRPFWEAAGISRVEQP